MVNYRFIFILLLITASSQAQLTKADYYIKIDNKIFQYSKEHNKQALNFDSVAAYVNSNYKSAEDRVRAYYTWIALNIYYDMEHMEEIVSSSKLMGLHHFRNVMQRPDTVLRRKRAVCEGFSELMNKFCKVSAIPSYMVTGYSKTPDGVSAGNLLHAWNAVKIDSTWQLLDVTWSNGYVDQFNKYHKHFSDKYFLTKPRIFLRDHLPSDPMWQLVNEPVTKKYFVEDDTLNAKPYATGNYNDSATAFMKLDAEQQDYVSLLHNHAYDPENKETAYNIDVYVNNVAFDLMTSAEMQFENYRNFYNNTLVKKPNAANFKKARTILESCKTDITKADLYLKNKKPLTQSFENNFQQNKESIVKNMAAINENLASLQKSQKMMLRK